MSFVVRASEKYVAIHTWYLSRCLYYAVSASSWLLIEDSLTGKILRILKYKPHILI